MTLFDMAVEDGNGRPVLKNGKIKKYISPKNLIDALLWARQFAATPTQKLQTDLCIRNLRRLERPNADKEKLVLFAIEHSMAWTIEDIVGDTGIARKDLIPILDSLIARGILRAPNRYIPGCSKPNYLYKSNRVNEPDVV